MYALALSRGVLCSLAVAVAAMVSVYPAQVRADDASAQCQSDAMIVFDASGSMGSTDYSLKVPRIARVKQAMKRVVPEIAPLRRIGLIVYGEGEYDKCDSIDLRLAPTANASDQLLAAVQGINPRGRTPLTESVRQAAEVLRFREKESTVVLLTDGEETCGGDPCKMAKALKTAGPGLTIHVIGYRDGPGGYFIARCMADLTGGKYVSVSTEEELIEAMRKTLGCPFVTERDRPFRAAAIAPASSTRRDEPAQCFANARAGSSCR